MAKVAKISTQDRRWQQESDARTLAEADVIRHTAPRMRGATTGAKRLASEQLKQGKAMQRVAKGRSGRGKGR